MAEVVFETFALEEKHLKRRPKLSANVNRMSREVARQFELLLRVLRTDSKRIVFSAHSNTAGKTLHVSIG